MITSHCNTIATKARTSSALYSGAGVKCNTFHGACDGGSSTPVDPCGSQTKRGLPSRRHYSISIFQGLKNGMTLSSGRRMPNVNARTSNVCHNHQKCQCHPTIFNHHNHHPVQSIKHINFPQKLFSSNSISRRSCVRAHGRQHHELRQSPNAAPRMP